MATCKGCGYDLPTEQFYRTHRGGIRGKCKQCCADEGADRYKKTKDFVGHNQKNLELPSQEWLKDNFDYSPSLGGHFIRLKPRGNSRAGSKVLGKVERHGYVRVGINYSSYLMHRLIWKWHHGTEPEFLDHIDHDRENNTIENLREINKKSNSRNQIIPSNNTSGFIGVSKVNLSGKWRAMIGVDYKDVVIGTYENIVDAVNAYNEKALEPHGDKCTYKVEQNIAELKRRGLA
jgi:hypothetical protein